jgi:hypothetical protein
VASGTIYGGEVIVRFNDQAGGMVVSDPAGNAEWTFLIPDAGVGLSVWVQACQQGLTTNVATTTIE